MVGMEDSTVCSSDSGAQETPEVQNVDGIKVLRVNMQKEALLREGGGKEGS